MCGLTHQANLPGENLFLEVLRIARQLWPQCVVIENVPGLVTLAEDAYLRAILGGLTKTGYIAALRPAAVRVRSRSG
jgi:site-specific DNA-cytosine methylase